MPIIFICLLISSSCSFLDSSPAMDVSIPVRQYAIPKIDHCYMYWLNEGNQIQEKITYPGNTESLFLSDELVLVQVDYYSFDNDSLASMGYWGDKKGYYELDEDQGCITNYMLKWIEAGYNVQDINWERFAQRACDVTKGNLYLLNSYHLINKLLQGEMNYFAFKRLENKEVVLPRGCDKQFYFCNPWQGLKVPGDHVILIIGQTLYWNEVGIKKALWLDSQGHILFDH